MYLVIFFWSAMNTTLLSRGIHQLVKYIYCTRRIRSKSFKNSRPWAGRVKFMPVSKFTGNELSDLGLIISNCEWTALGSHGYELVAYHTWNIDLVNPGIWTFARNWESGESTIYSYILAPLNLIENDHNFLFFGLNYQFSNTVLKI